MPGDRPGASARLGRRVLKTLLLIAAFAVLATIAHAPDAAFSDDPADADTLYKQARRLERTGRLEAATAAYHAATARNSERIEAHLGYIDLMAARWRRAEAAAEYARLRERHPGSALHLFLHAYASRDVHGDPARTEEDLRRATRLDPTFVWPYAHMYERRAYESPEEYAAAIRALDRCAALAPRLADCHREAGMIHLRNGAHALATIAFDRALAMDSDSRHRPRIQVYRIENLSLAGEDERALEALDATMAEYGPQAAFSDRVRFYETLESRIGGWLRSTTKEEVADHLRRRQIDARKTLVALLASDPAPAHRVRLHLIKFGMAHREGSVEEAIEHLTRALDHVLTPEMEARTRDSRCRARRSMGELQGADEDCRIALRNFARLGFSREVQDVSHQLAHVREELGDMDGAIAYSKRHLAMARRIGSQGDVMSALKDVGWFQWRIGDVSGAREALHEMTEIVEERKRWFYEAAEFHEALGDYTGALRYYLAGVEDDWGRGEAYGNYARSAHGLARLYARLGDLDEARHWAEAYDRYLRSFAFFDLPYPSLGEVHRLAGEPWKAVAHARYWLRTAESHAAFALAARRDLALSYLAARQIRLAIREMEALLEEYEARHRFWERGEILIALADARLDLGDQDAAEERLADAERHMAVTRDPEGEWRIAHLQGRLAERQGLPAEAARLYQEAIGEIERLRWSAPGDPLRSGFLESRLAPFDDAIALALDHGDEIGAFRVAQREKGGALDFSLDGDSLAPPPRGDPARASLGARLNAAQRRLRAELDRPGPSRRPERIRRLQQEIDDLRRSFRSILDRTAVSGTRDRSAERYDLPRLAPDQALVEYTFVHDRIVAFVVRDGQVHAKRLAIDRRALQSAIDALLGPLEALDRGEIGLAHATWDLDRASRLHDRLFRPLRLHLAGIRRIVLVPDGDLWRLPFDALPVGEVRPPAPRTALFSRYESVRFLGDEFIVTLASSSRPVSRTDSAGGGVLALGAVPSGAWRPLPGARQELADIRSTFPGAIVREGPEATEKFYRARADRFRVLHFATHGVEDPASPLYSGLLLAPGEEDDGWLQAWEIAEVPLTADLVVLSACRTASGRVKAGEGAITLGRAFLSVGAKSVVAGLWPVPDDASLLMRGFYREIAEGRPVDEALAAAKRGLRTRRFRLPDGREASYAHPVYWASFVLVRPGV